MPPYGPKGDPETVHWEDVDNTFVLVKSAARDLIQWVDVMETMDKEQR
jgi:hypothetical protein